MSKRRKKIRTGTDLRSEHAKAEMESGTSKEGKGQQGGGESVLLLGIATSLIWCRCLMPAESVASGDTALIVFVWCLFGSLICWLGWKWKHSKILRFDLIDVSLVVIAAGYVVALSALWSLGGQLRAGVNTSWEWIGSVIGLLIFRALWRDSTSNLPLVVLLSVGLTVSFQGVYQHHVQFPQQREAVMPLVENWRALIAEEPAESSEFARQRWEQKKQDLERQLYASGIPTDLHTQDIFLQRLHSSEAIGRFALANTLAGLLVVCLLILLGLGVQGFLVSRAESTSSAGWILTTWGLMGVVAYCLLLTKSRTAWAGGLAGIFYLVVGVIFSRRNFQQQFRRIPPWGVPACLTGVALLVGAAFLSGSLDLEVITEANKSLQYRLEYWSASWKMLSERWLLGTGPGNFRQNYLAFKLPASSEEILDPHNLWLDVWAGGGLLGLMGALLLVGLLLVFAGRALGGNGAHEGESHEKNLQQSCSLKQVMWTSALTGFFSLILASPDISQPVEEWLILLLTLLMCAWLVQGICRSGRFSSLVLSAGAIALLVHLQGAGGFGMPAIFQLLVVVGASQEAGKWQREFCSEKILPVASGGLLLLAFAGWGMVIAPHLAAARAQNELANATSASAVKSALARWREADGLSPDPWLQQGSYLCSTGFGARNPLLIQEGIAALETAIERDPRNYSGYRMLAENQYRLAELTGELADYQAAVDSQRQAIARYPHLARLYVEQAGYLAALLARESQTDRREQLKSVAQKGVELHEMNEQAGHPDRMLSANDLLKLKKVLAAGQETTNDSASEP